MKPRIAIGYRLFLAMLLAVFVMAVAGLALVRWGLFGTQPPTAIRDERPFVAALASSLAQQYQQHGDWRFLPEAGPQRRQWLLQQWHDLAAATTVPPPSQASLIGYRLALLDQDRQVLAGTVAHRLMVTFASLDSVERAIVVDGQAVGFLVDAIPRSARDELAVAFLIDQQENLLIAATVAALLSMAMAAGLAVHFRRPIKQLAENSRLLEQGRFEARVSMHRSDELGDLATAFNRLAERLGAAEQARQQWIADTSHELRTPLAVLQGQLEALQEGIRAATPENLALMLRHVQSLTTLVDDLYQLARADIGQLDYHKQPCDVWQLMISVSNSFAERLDRAQLALTLGPAPEDAVIWADAARLRQAMTNLLENSVRYTAAGGCVQISGSTTADRVQILIADSAPGVPATALAQLGQRFFRLESSRSRQHGGSGLGLSLARQIIEAHDGQLSFAQAELGGLSVTMSLQRLATA